MREQKTVVFIFWTFSGNFIIGLNLTDITFWENIKCVVVFFFNIRSGSNFKQLANEYIS